MSVFSLFIYSCITINFPLSNDLMQRTCRWEGGGTLYATRELCLKASPPLNSPIFSDIADGRKVEAIKCNEQSVVQ